MKNKSILILLILPFICFSQKIWKSSKYAYSLKIPKGYKLVSKTGMHSDFMAVKGLSASIGIQVVKLPSEISQYSIWEELGDLKTFGKEWEKDFKGHPSNPKFVKYGKTTINGLDTFWFDYTTDIPKSYNRQYQVKKGYLNYTFTLSCLKSKYQNNIPVWNKFIKNINFK